MITVLSLFMYSCSDDSSPAGPEEGEAPRLPTFDAIQPDLSFFLENNPQKAKQPANNFNAAKQFALSFSSITSFGQVYSGFFQGATQSGAEMEGGAYVWDYDYSYGGESASVVLTSRESGNEFIWDMTISYSGPEGSYDDYTIVSGRTSKDGMSGSWTFNSLSTDGSEEVPFLVSSWEKTGDSQVSIETNYYAESGSLEGSFSYTQEANDFMLEASDFEGGDNSTTQWNTETQEGYIEIGGERQCWDSSLQDSACSN